MERKQVSFEEILRNEEARAYVLNGDLNLAEMGFTEHGLAHAKRCAEYASLILRQLGYAPRMCELAAIAGYLHDIGNVVNRVNHAQSGALMAFQLLNRLEMEPEETALVTSAIGNHDEGTAYPVSPVAAALILADKGDVRRSRVREKYDLARDIHDRVNYAVVKSGTTLDAANRTVALDLTIDTKICPVMEYFEIFMERMVLCRQAATRLELSFELIINGTRLL